MEFAVNIVKQILGGYETQSKTAELVKQSEIKVVQSQKDRVTISPKARELLLSNQKVGANSNTPSSQTTAGENILSA